jgi:NTE family protein
VGHEKITDTAYLRGGDPLGPFKRCARGISHIGVIRELERLNIPIDYVAGLYATGMNSEELEAAVQAVDWKEIFIDETPREERTSRRKRDDDYSLYGPKLGVGEDSSLLPAGAVAGQKITLFFQEQVSQRVQTKHFDDLPIPFRAVAADVVDDTAVIIEDDDLAFAMRSSMSIPGIFAPVHYRDHILVDGGIAKNLPVDVVRNMRAIATASAPASAVCQVPRATHRNTRRFPYTL